jgi:hypothetical protein
MATFVIVTPSSGVVSRTEFVKIEHLRPVSSELAISPVRAVRRGQTGLVFRNLSSNSQMSAYQWDLCVGTDDARPPFGPD